MYLTSASPLQIWSCFSDRFVCRRDAAAAGAQHNAAAGFESHLPLVGLVRATIGAPAEAIENGLCARLRKAESAFDSSLHARSHMAQNIQSLDWQELAKFDASLRRSAYTNVQIKTQGKTNLR